MVQERLTGNEAEDQRIIKARIEEVWSLHNEQGYITPTQLYDILGIGGGSGYKQFRSGCKQFDRYDGFELPKTTMANEAKAIEDANKLWKLANEYGQIKSWELNLVFNSCPGVTSVRKRFRKYGIAIPEIVQQHKPKVGSKTPVIEPLRSITKYTDCNLVSEGIEVLETKKINGQEWLVLK
jgi:hypothetical protein